MSIITTTATSAFGVVVAIGAIHLGSSRLYKIHTAAAALPPPPDPVELQKAIEDAAAANVDRNEIPISSSGLSVRTRGLIIDGVNVLSVLVGLAIMLSDPENTKSLFPLLSVFSASVFIYRHIRGAIMVLSPLTLGVKYAVPLPTADAKFKPRIQVVIHQQSGSPPIPLTGTLLLPVLSVCLLAANRFGYTDVNCLWLGAILLDNMSRYQRLGVRSMLKQCLYGGILIPATLCAIAALGWWLDRREGVGKGNKSRYDHRALGPSIWLNFIVAIPQLSLAIIMAGKIAALNLRYDAHWSPLPSKWEHAPSSLSPNHKHPAPRGANINLLPQLIPPFPKPFYTATLVSIGLTFLPVIGLLHLVPPFMRQFSFMILVASSMVLLLTVPMGVGAYAWYKGEMKDWLAFEDPRLPNPNAEEAALVAFTDDKKTSTSL